MILHSFFVIKRYSILHIVNGFKGLQVTILAFDIMYQQWSGEQWRSLSLADSNCGSQPYAPCQTRSLVGTQPGVTTGWRAWVGG